MSTTPPRPAQSHQGMQERATTAADSARREAGAVMDDARSQASDGASAGAEQARAVVDDAKHQARRLVDDSRQQLMSQASEQTARLAGSVRDVSRQLQGVSQGGAPPQGIVADIADQAAGVTSRLADQLENRRPEELLDDVRRYARQRPGMFLVGALGAGFVVGRLMRSVDTGAVAEAAKAGAQSGSDDGTAQHLGGSDQTMALPSADEPREAGALPEDLSRAVRV